MKVSRDWKSSNFTSNISTALGGIGAPQFPAVNVRPGESNAPGIETPVTLNFSGRYENEIIVRPDDAAYRDGKTAVEIALLTGEDHRVVRRRIRRLAVRVNGLARTEPDHETQRRGPALAPSATMSASVIRPNPPGVPVPATSRFVDLGRVAIGQGGLNATPLQMAVMYASLANGGTVVRPHVGLDVETPQGQIDQRLTTPSTRKLDFPSGYDTILAGLHDATSQSGGTSTPVFADWPQDKYPLYGKTGTAQRTGKNDQSWFAAFVKNPATHTPIVIVTTVEDGGFGADSAAPATCQMLSYWYKAKASCTGGGSNTF